MKMRGLRRKKKSIDNEDTAFLLPTSTTSIRTNTTTANSLTPARKAFRRRFPPQVVVTSPMKKRFSNNNTSSVTSSTASRALSALTAEDEEESLAEMEPAFVTPEKIPRTSASLAIIDSSSNNNGTSTSSSSSAIVSASWEEMGVVDCVVDWLDAVGSLATSPEMHRFLHSSGHLVLSAGGLAVQTAFLPVTVPWHVANQTTRFVVGQCVSPILGVTQLLLQNHHGHHESTSHSFITSEQPVREEEEEKHEERNPIIKVAKGMWEAPGHVIGFANHVKDGLGGIVLRTLAPTLHGTIQESCRPGESTAETAQPGQVLERLRLDYSSESVESRKSVTFSHFLLRVDDLQVTDEEKRTVYFVDLNDLEDKIVLHSLDRLVHIGISLIANHPTVRLSNQAYVAQRNQEIEWKPEGNTSKLLKRLSKMDILDRLETLRTETLIWSGRFQHDVQTGYDRQSRFYLARGVLNMKPRALLELLWDNGRTADYNKFCLGRTTLAGNDLEFLNGTDKVGTKVIQSETRVPLTSISVTVKCLMHARVLPDNTGYIIVSRSCTAGPAGNHCEALKNVSRAKNEIHWGVNILRRVPNREDLVDLTSHSQVGTAGVPQFLAAKIALMGVEGFFENARKLCK